jgi:hypothetical protein
MPVTSVLHWLLTNHPELHRVAELDRTWLWLPIDLSGEANHATRESLKAFGFHFKRSGVHKLPSGKDGTWSHSCSMPIRFKSKRPIKPMNTNHLQPQRADPLADARSYDLPEEKLNELCAAFA